MTRAEMEMTRADPKTMREDPEEIREDPEAIREDLEAIREDLEAIREELEAIREDLEAIREDLEAIRENLELDVQGVRGSRDVGLNRIWSWTVSQDSRVETDRYVMETRSRRASLFTSTRAESVTAKMTEIYIVRTSTVRGLLTETIA
jgi:chromosome segregation ATPase